MEHDIPFGNSNRENGTTFLDFPIFLGIFQWDEPTKRVPFTAEPEILEILTKWKAPLETTYWFRLKKKRLVRVITKAHYLENTAPLFSQLKVLDIFSINSFSVATFMYSYHHNLLPSTFRDLFLSSNQVHQYETRLSSQYRPHFCRTNIKQFSILYRGPKIWNSLPISLISSPSIFVF